MSIKTIKKTSFADLILDFIELLFISATVFIIVYFFVGQLLEVYGDSMLPNFHNEERLVAEKLSLKFRDLHRGEVVIFVNPRYPEEKQRLIIKRVIGLPGEVVKISGGKVYINDQQMDESAYIDQNLFTEGKGALENDTSYKIAEDSYVLLGDNRQYSRDSRDWGAIKLNRIVGRAFVVYYPISNMRVVKNPIKSN